MIYRASLSQTSQSSLTTRQLSRIVDTITALLFAVMLALIAIFPMNVNHDAALFLDTGGLILDGKMPYVDFTEINFPLVMYLHAIPVEIGRVLHVNPIPVFSLLVFALEIGSLWTLRHIFRRRYDGDVPLALQLIPLIIAFYSLYLFLIAEYGQREYLFMLLFLPGFALRWGRWQDRSVKWSVALALLLGLMAGVGAAIKPHFLPIAFAPEIYWVASALLKRDFQRAKRTLLKPEVVSFVGFGALYALAILFSPAIRDALVNVVLPYVTSSYASYDIGVTPWTLLWRLDTVLMWLALIAALPVVIHDRPLARPLWALTFVAILVFCWQGKGWYYHRIPAIFGILVLLITTVVYHDSFRHPIFDTFFKVILVLLAYGIITLGGVVQLNDYFPSLRDAILQHSQPGDPVMFIDSSVDPAYPLLIQTGRRSADPNLSGFPVGVDSDEDPDLAGYLVSIAHSIQQRQPPLILIDAEPTCYGCSPGYGMWQYLDQTGYIGHYILPGYTDAGKVSLFEMYLRK